jgi:hypothetical protein
LIRVHSRIGEGPLDVRILREQRRQLSR